MTAQARSATPGQHPAGPAAAPVFELAYEPPCDWNWLTGFLARRTIPGVESVADGVYRRVFAPQRGAGGIVGWLEVRDCPGRDRLAVTLSPSLAPDAAAVLRRLADLFDTNCRPGEVAAALGALADPHPGIRLPGTVDGFELAVRAILGQQVSVRAAHTLAGRLVERFGTAVETPHQGLGRAFPSPDRLAGQPLSAIAGIGIVAQRARALLALAEAVAHGRLALEPQADVDETLARLTSLPGIGDWTAQYVAMRALRWRDAFPAADLVVMRALGVRTPKAAREAADRWRPWRAYAVMHLWSGC